FQRQPRKDHQLCHLGKKPFECAECGKCFLLSSQLQQHQRKPYSCTDCNKHFFHSSHLLKHKTSHLPFLSSSTDFINHLKNHVEIDNNIKRESDDEDVGTLSTFLCPVCHQNFPSATEVISHFSAHFNGECVNKKQKPVDVNEGKTKTKTIKYRCSLCGLSFSANNALQHHCSHQQEETLHSTVAHSTQNDLNLIFLSISVSYNSYNAHLSSCHLFVFLNSRALGFLFHPKLLFFLKLGLFRFYF
uniref:C2H2-type domain-containing protein n=1 Tax=Gouania willdenowi TaxID=441366 RepID=A0A8C5DWA3_GOUWI